jgi:hypothetical protein
VLVAGGTTVGGPSGAFVIRRSALVYDPSSNSWSEIAPMGARRTGARAVLLPGEQGGALVVGSSIFASDDLQSAEVLSGRHWAPTGPLTTDASVSIFDGGLVEDAGVAIQFAGVDLSTGAASARVFAFRYR